MKEKKKKSIEIITFQEHIYIIKCETTTTTTNVVKRICAEENSNCLKATKNFGNKETESFIFFSVSHRIKIFNYRTDHHNDSVYVCNTMKEKKKLHTTHNTIRDMIQLKRVNTNTYIHKEWTLDI